MDLAKIGVRPPQSPDDLRQRVVVDERSLTLLGELGRTRYFETRLGGRTVEVVFSGEILAGPYDGELGRDEIVVASEPFVSGGRERRRYGVARRLPSGSWEALRDEHVRVTGTEPVQQAIGFVRLDPTHVE